MITPAISVLSAVEGLKLAAPALEHYVVPLTVFILVVLFSVQSERHRARRVVFRAGDGGLVRRAGGAAASSHISDDPDGAGGDQSAGTRSTSCSRTAPSAS